MGATACCGSVYSTATPNASKLCAMPGIQCFRDLAALLSYCAELEFKVVAQRYITRPLVIRRKKVQNCQHHSLPFALRRW